MIVSLSAPPAFGFFLRCNILLVACLTGCLSLSPLKAQSYLWRNAEIGGGGFVTGTVFHPAEPGLVYTRTDVGGIYRLDAVTKRWIPLNDDIGGLNNEFQHLGVLTIGLDPSDPDRVFIATGQYGGTESWKLPSRIYRSSNRGNTWDGFVVPGFKMAGNGEGRGTGERMAVSPDDGRIILLGTSDSGLWKSTDRAVSWSRVTSFPSAIDHLNFVQYAPANASGPGPARRVYAAGRTLTEASLLYSDDNGVTWTPAPNQPGREPGKEMFPLMGSFDAAGTFYVTWGDQTGPGSFQTNYRVAKLAAGATTWTTITPPTGMGGFAGISADPRVAGHVVATTLHRWWPADLVYRSTNGGATWTDVLLSSGTTIDISSAPWATPKPHWMTDIDIDPFNSDRVLFNTGFGLFQTANLSAAHSSRVWEFYNNGLEELVPLGLHSPTAGANLISATGDYTGFRHDNLQRSPRRGALAPMNGSNAYVTGAHLAPLHMVRQHSTDSLFSTDGGAAWSRFASTPPSAINGHYRIAIAADGSKYYWVPPGSGPYVTTDLGATWTARPNGSLLINADKRLLTATLAGSLGNPGSANGTSATFNGPSAIALGPTGVRYVADTANHAVRVINIGANTTTLAGVAGSVGSTDATGSAARFNSPAGITFASGFVFVADTANHTLRRITTGGVVTTFAGAPGIAGSTDATGSAARFNSPRGLAADSAGNLYVADSANHVIRRVSPSGVVTTLAGSAGASGFADGTGSAARFNTPQAVAVDAAGNVFVADTANHTIRRITPAGVVTTLAGSAGASGSTNATGSAARFNAPRGIAIDAQGVLFVADTGNHTLRRIEATGAVTTVAGTATASGTTNGEGATARFNAPSGLAVQPDGFYLYVADSANHGIRSATPNRTLTPFTCKADPERLYLLSTAARTLLRSSDGGVSYSTVNTALPTGAAFLRTVPGLANHVWLRAGTNGLHRSTNGGASFSKLSSVTEVYHFDFGRAAPGTTHPAIFIWGRVGGVLGFFRSDNIGASWVRINNNSQNFGYINDLVADPRVYGRVYLGTSGRGVIYGELIPATPPPSQASTLLYGDSTEIGWTPSASAGVNLASTTNVLRGTHAIAVPAASGSTTHTVSFSTDARSNIGLAALSFWVSAGASTPPPALRVGASRGGVTLETYPVPVPSGTGWQRVLVPLEDLGLENIDDLTGLRIEAYSVGGVLPPAYALDDIALIGTTDFTTPTQFVFGYLLADYDGQPKSVVVTTNPPGRQIVVTYDGSPNPPSAIGTYTVTARLLDPFATGSATETFRIAGSIASIQLGNLTQWADGGPKVPTVTTTPPGLDYTLTYDGSPHAPSAPGRYTVVATVTSPLYYGTTSATLHLRQPSFAPTPLTGWGSNLPGKVSAASSGSPLFTPDDTTDSFSTNTLQARFPALRLENVGDTVTVTGSFKLGSAGAGSTSNWFRFGLFDHQGQASDVITGWLGGASIGGAYYERIAVAGLYSTGSGSTARTADTSPAPISQTSPSGTPTIAFETKVARLANGVLHSYLLRRTDTNAVLLNFNYTDPTPNNNGTLGVANNTATGYIPTYNTAGFAFGRAYVGSNPAPVQFTDVRLAFTSGIVLQDQFITFPRPVDRRLDSAPFTLNATASSGLPVSFELVSGPATLTGSTLTLTGPGQVTIRATQTGNQTFDAAPPIEQSFLSTKLPATIVFSALSVPFSGGPMTPEAVTQPAGLAVSYAFVGLASPPANVGSYSFTASIQDPSYQGETFATLVITRGSQTITFPAPAGQGVGTTFTASATSSAGLPVSYTVVSGPAYVDGSNVTITGTGTVTLRASQPGDANVLPATPVERTFDAVPGTASITLSNLTTMYDGQPKAVSFVTQPPGLDVTLTYNGSPTPPSARGSYTVVASIADPDYTGSTTAQLIISPRVVDHPLTGWASNNPAIVIAHAATASPTLNSTQIPGGASGNTLHAFFDPITLAHPGDKITVTGTVTLAHGGISGQGSWFRFGLFDNRGQAPDVYSGWLGYLGVGNGLWERTGSAASAPFVSTSDASQRGPDVSPSPISSNSPSGAPTLRFEVSATRTVAGVHGNVTGVVVTHSLVRTDTNTTLMRYSYTDTSPNNNGVITGSNSTANPSYLPSFNAVGFGFASNYVSATNPAAAAFSDVRLVYEAAADAPAHTIDFAPPPDLPYSAAPIPLTATSSAGLPVSFELVSGPATLAGPLLTPTGVGEITIRATQSGTLTVPPAANVEQSFQITKAAAAITLSGLIATYDGSPKSVAAITEPAGLPVILTYEDQPIAPSAAGNYTIVATIDHPLYSGETTATLVIGRIAQTIQFTPPAGLTFGHAPVTLQATSSSGLPVVFTVLGGPALLVDNLLTFTGAGLVSVRASQSGDAFHAPAPDLDQSFLVAKAPATVTLSGLSAVQDGTPKSVTATTEPAGLAVEITYDGSVTAPSAAGAYTVVATVQHADYAGSTSATFVISPALTVPGLTLALVGGHYQVGLPSLPGFVYQLERASDLAARDWLPLGPPVAGTGATLTFSDPAVPVLPRRFYRVVITPASP